MGRVGKHKSVSYYSTFLLFVAYLQPHDVMTFKEASDLERPISSPMMTCRRLLCRVRLLSRTWIQVMSGLPDLVTVPGTVIVFLLVLWIHQTCGVYIMLWVIIIIQTVDWSDVTQLHSSRVGKCWWSAPLNHIQRWSRPVPQQISNVNVSWCITSNLKQNKLRHFGHVWKRLKINLKHLWSQTRLRHLKPDLKSVSADQNTWDKC